MTQLLTNEAGADLRVGDWRVFPARNEIRRGDESVKLELKVIEVLIHLARRAGQVVGREELLSAVWPGVVVGDDALTQAIIKLRKALGDDAHRPRFIETISKRGYRLIAPVIWGDKPSDAANAAPTADRRRKLRLAAASAAAVAIALGVLVVGTDAARRIGLPWPVGAGDKAGLTAVSIPTIAVLPFANLSGDSQRDYFSDGLTEDIINALGRYSGLRVISRNSIETYKTRSAPPQGLRNELGVRYIVKGSLREADGRMRVSVEMSEAEKGVVLWAERYEGDGSKVFEMQDRIVRSIVGALAVKVSRLELERSASKAPKDLEAYDLTLQARALLARSERVANRQARALLAKALEKTPDYAEAHVTMASAHSQRAVMGWVEDPAAEFQLAEQSARRALAIDDPGAHARSHALLSTVYVTRGQFDMALSEASRALELNPSDAHALEMRGVTFLWLGRFDEAAAAMELALRFNPAGRGPTADFPRILSYYMLGRHAEALAAAEATSARFPEASFIHAIRAVVLAETGRREEAARAAAEVRRLDPFFRPEQFGTRFVQPENYARLQEGLRKAGL